MEAYPGASSSGAPSNKGIPKNIYPLTEIYPPEI